MRKIENGLQILMWTVVVLMILIFFATIIIGHSTNFNFWYSFQEVPELTNIFIQNSKIML